MKVSKVKYSELINNIGFTLKRAKENAYKAINSELIKANWDIGRHIVEYEQDGKPMMMKSSLGITGVDARQTAMAKTVGLPLAVTCKLFMENRFNKRGLLIPTDQEVYDQVLPELEQLGIVFQETTHPA